MKKILSPNEICVNFLQGKICKLKASELINILLEISKDPKIRVNAIELFETVGLKSKKVYRTLENHLLSDEIPLVRSTAAKVIYFLFPKTSISPLIWTIQNDNSIEVLNKLLHLFENSNKYSSEILKKCLNEQLSKDYGVSSEEARFLLELDNSIKIYEKRKLYRAIIKDNHIINLNLAGLKLRKIPESIGSLSNLKHLNLWDNALKSLPESFENIINLESLYLDYNDFKKLPEIWDRMKSLRKLSLSNNYKLKKIPRSLIKLAKDNFAQKYIDEGVTSEEAPILGLLEILIGQKLKKIFNRSDLSKLCASNYKIDELGHIAGIYVYGYYSFQITFFPEQICSLQFLEELIIKDQDFKTIPESIKNLQSLRILDLMRNKIEIIPEFIHELKLLMYLDLGENPISFIPDSIKNSKIDVWI